MNQPAPSSISVDMASENASVETEAMRAFRKRVHDVVTPGAMGRFRERLEMSRRLEEESGSSGGYNRDVL